MALKFRKPRAAYPGKQEQHVAHKERIDDLINDVNHGDDFIILRRNLQKELKPNLPPKS